MKTHHFQAFYQVMLTGSITDAAHNLGRSQPAVSKTIMALEEQLGITLFDRTAMKLKPRIEAQVMFERLHPVMEQLHDIERSMIRLDPEFMPSLSIIAANNVGTHLIPSRIAPLAAKGQAIRVMNGSAARIISAMEAQQYDIALMDEGSESVPTDSPLYEQERFEVPIYAIYPKGLLDAPNDRVGPDQLRPHRICSLYQEHRVGRELSAIFGPPQIEFQNFYPMACFALQSESIALVDYITCTTVAALNGSLSAEWARLDGDLTSAYHLLRPRFRPQSNAADDCHSILRQAMLDHATA